MGRAPQLVRAARPSPSGLLRPWHLEALQAAFGPGPELVSDDLERRQRTQARVAVYLPGARVTDTARWGEYQDWCIDVLGRFRAALGAVPEIRARW